jgi:hypothetical protein
MDYDPARSEAVSILVVPRAPARVMRARALALHVQRLGDLDGAA